MPYELQAAVTSWVAQELQLLVPDQDIGYWVQLEGGNTSLPRVEIILATATDWTLELASWPPTERGLQGVRAATNRALHALAEKGPSDG